MLEYALDLNDAEPRQLDVKDITSPTGPFAMPIFQSRHLSEQGQHDPQESQNPSVRDRTAERTADTGRQRRAVSDAAQGPASRPSGASAEAISYHYDAGTEFYRLWLDQSLTYSAARWGDPRQDPRQVAVSPVSLELAQEAKLDFHLKAVAVGRATACLTSAAAGARCCAGRLNTTTSPRRSA